MRQASIVPRRRSSAVARPTSHYIPISPSSAAEDDLSYSDNSASSADAPISLPPQPHLHPLLAGEGDDYPASSPQLKFQQKEWGASSNKSGLGLGFSRRTSEAAPLAWRNRGGDISGGRRKKLRYCYVLLLVPLSGLFLLIYYTLSASSPSTPAAHLHSWASSLSSSASSRLHSLSTYRSSNSTLRSPHSTYAFAVPLPNERGAYEEHPIHGLIREAKGKWEEKRNRQSKTFEEAVREYGKRYGGRKPPPGFQHWWYWANENKVQLLDEYDSIFSQIEPFLSLRPSEVRRRLTHLEQTPKTDGRDHTLLHIHRGGRKITHSGASWRPAVSEGFESLVKGIAHMLPDLEGGEPITVATYLHDASHTQIGWDAMEGYRKAAGEGRWVNETELPIQGETPWTWRLRTCPLNSALHRSITGLNNNFKPPGPSFVRSHHNEMSYCTNPQNLDLHGSTSGNVYLRPLEPSFALSRTGPDGDLLWPSTIQYDLNPKNESAFLEKQNKIVWRGSPDGIWVGRNMKWRQSQRMRLLTLTNSNDTAPRLLRLTLPDRLGREYQLDTTSSLAELNERYMDIKATGGPVQCEEDLCQYLRETMKFVEKSSLESMADHRYVMDVDGNAYSARFRTHLLGNQLPFKATIYEEWYTSRIQPWVHYIPVRMDYSDLYNLLSFFDGDLTPERKGHHDKLAEEIAHAGKEWAETHWREVDMQAYVFRLLLEYARVLDPAREREHD
ncbi:hypothetical protein JCM11251_005974 [Rhodosporidiobolus azoricus]